MAKGAAHRPEWVCAWCGPPTLDRVTSEHDVWAAALARAERLTEQMFRLPGPEQGEREDWDHYGVRGMLAIAIYATALRTEQPVTDVPLGRILVPLLDRDDFLAQAHVLTRAGHDLGNDTNPGAVADPVVQQWKWLLRTWDPDAEPGARWDGMTRGIARGLPDPAIDVLYGWARGAVEDPLARERGAISARTPVEITAGEYAGVVGRIEGFDYDRAEGDLVPGPPSRYSVNLGAAHGFRVEMIRAEHLSVIEQAPT